jgi:hypothetical protein
VLDFLASEPALANLFGSDVWVGVAEIAAARRHLVERLAALLRDGRKRDAFTSEAPAGTELLLIEGAFGLIANRVAAGEAERLQELAPELAELLG